jgi:hypothetical protein
LAQLLGQLGVLLTCVRVNQKLIAKSESPGKFRGLGDTAMKSSSHHSPHLSL